MRFHQLSPFKKHLRSSFSEHLLPAYLILGKDDEGRREALACFVELFKKNTSLFSVKQFDARELNFEDLYGEINTIMAFEKIRLVILHHAVGMAKPFLDSIKKYLKNPNKSVCFVIEASSLAKEMSTLTEKSGAILDLLPEKSWEKEKRICQWIDQVVRKQSMTIEKDAKDCLIRWVGINKSELELELEKLMTYAFQKKHISKNDVVTICTYHAQETIWKLYDGILLREPLKTLYVLRSLMHENIAPQMILAQLRGHFQMLLKITHSNNQESMQALLKQYFYLKGRLLERHRGAARAYGEESLKKGIIDIYQTDLKMREGLEDSQALLESLVAKLTFQKVLA